jgi:hypothetical protein
MKNTTLIVLIGVTAVVGGAAAWVSTKGRATRKSEVATEMLFPDLAKRVNDVASVSIKKASKEFAFTRTATGWEVADKGGYPAKIEKVKETLIALSQLKVLEPKTSRPENYSKIGVEDPGTVKPQTPATPGEPAPESQSTLLTLKDDKGQTITGVIVGNTRWDAKPATYLRKAGEAQAWLADGRLDVPADFTAWVDTQFASIPKDRIKTAEVTFPDGSKTRISREKKEDVAFTVHDIPPGEELMGANAGDALGNALSFQSFENVAPADQVFSAAAGEMYKPGPSGEFVTFDGMKIMIQMREQEVPAKEGAEGATKQTKHWLHMVAAYDETIAPPPPPEPKPGEPTPPAVRKPEEVQKEVTDLNNKTAKWAFQIPEYKASALKTTVAQLLKSKVPTPPPTLNEGNQAAPMNPMPLPGALPPQDAPAPTTPPAAPTGSTGPTAPTGEPITPVPAPDSKPESPVKPPETPPQPAPTGG